MLLGVNIDHIAVLREARRINDPDPVDALGIVKRAGADQITIHLREDRRHIHDEDARRIVELSPLPVNIECAIAPDIVKIVKELNPNRVTLVPEKREEVTTEGGLDLNTNFDKIAKTVDSFHKKGIEVSLFVDPDLKLMEKAHALKADWVEIHTGTYANIFAMLFSNLGRTHHSIADLEKSRSELLKLLENSLDFIAKSAAHADILGLKVAAGHGLNYQNVMQITRIVSIVELNIGQSIIARSVFTGLEEAIVSMKRLLG
ncbi:MAG: pyridoxine 5'-phosphate synthase [Campylobacteraceae bacterium]|nr:pyridoxine 5'-phosphate synthase [Campylobacteraceae bacterium]